MTPEPSDIPITRLLRRARLGDQEAVEELLPMVYSELRRLAAGQLRRDRRSHTLQPTALVNEAFLRLFGAEMPDWGDRAHFLGIVARVMRQVLVDHARKRQALKRSGGVQVTMADLPDAGGSPSLDLVMVEAALDRMAESDARMARLIELRFFAGMTAEETAEFLGESPHVVRRELRLAMAILRHDLARRSPLKKVN